MNKINELNKYSIHTLGGDYMGYTSKNVESIIRECDKMNADSGKIRYCVMQHYMAASPWDKEKITEHGKKIH